jgi:uncharacterized repeat protein (TIGR01451 family)
MKKIYNSFLFLFCLLLASQANAATHTITVANYVFTPSTLSVNVGDSIIWVWSSGTHTTTSSTIPPGAATWNSPISNTTTSFVYEVTTAGTYDYLCQPHGFTGQFVATNSSNCTAFFMWYGPSGVPATINFLDSSMSVNSIQTWSWNFGDGATSTIQNPIHTYSVAGDYQACLTIDDGMGCTNQWCDSVHIGTAPNSINVYFDVDSSSLFNCSAPYGVNYTSFMTAQGYTPGDTFDFHINFGDGLDSTFTLAPTSLSYQASISHVYQNAGSYTASMTVIGRTDSLYTTSNAQTIVVASSCGTVSGIVYNDLNGNCTYNSGEELPNINLEIYNGTTFSGWATTNSAGEYFFNVPTGSTYDVHVNSYSGSLGHYAPSCPPNGILNVSTVPSTGNNIGVACPTGFDLQGSISGWGFRPGFTSTICVYAYNLSCTTPSGQIEVTLSPNVIPLPDSSGFGYTISGNTVTLPINSPDLYWSFCIPVTVDVNAQIGDSVCVVMNITPSSGDSNPANNFFSYCFPVRNSWDPNDKTPNPTGEGPNGYIKPNTDINYTIRFQNTGSADAINIYILDTISPNLDASSIEVIAHSHPMTYSLLLGNILRFNFDNINLPDSNSNEPASHGYVTYHIKQSPTIAHLAQITNTAYIYFDFNQPVVTNTTLNTMDMFLGTPSINNINDATSLFPNPAYQDCIIRFVDNGKKTISISDVSGKETYRISTTDKSYLLDIKDLENGIYLVKIIDDNNQVKTGKLIVSH